MENALNVDRRCAIPLYPGLGDRITATMFRGASPRDVTFKILTNINGLLDDELPFPFPPRMNSVDVRYGIPLTRFTSG